MEKLDIDAVVAMLRSNRGKKIATAMFPPGFSVQASLDEKSERDNARCGRLCYALAQWGIALMEEEPDHELDVHGREEVRRLLGRATDYAVAGSDHRTVADTMLQRLVMKHADLLAAVGRSDEDRQMLLQRMRIDSVGIHDCYKHVEDYDGLLRLMATELEILTASVLLHALCDRQFNDFFTKAARLVIGDCEKIIRHAPVPAIAAASDAMASVRKWMSALKLAAQLPGIMFQDNLMATPDYNPLFDPI